MKVKTGYLYLTAAAVMTLAAVSAYADYSLVRLDEKGATLRDGNKETVITALTPEIFKVFSRPVGTDMQPVKSQSAILGQQEVNLTSYATSKGLILSSPTTTIYIDRASGRISFADSTGFVLLSESEGVDNKGDVKRVSFMTPENGSLHGAGERGHKLRLNGDSLTMYNRQNYGYTGGDSRINQMNITVPWFASDRGFGVLFDDYNAASLTLGKDSITYSSETPKPLAYYFINGEGTLAGTAKGLADLTGHQPLPPFWAMGYITSKYGYHNQQETIGAIDSLQSRGYPVDGIVLDLYWYGKETDMGRFEWNKEQWPDHKKMLAELRDRGVKTITISQPYLNKIGAIDNYNELSAKGMLVKDNEGKTHDVTTWVGDAGMLDVSNPATRDWLWNRYRTLTLDGVEGWWGDLGEPEVHPLTAVHDNGETASQYHNVYGNEWSRILAEGFSRDFPKKRLALLMRGGTAGLQRYGVLPWSTDVSRSWGGLEPQVRIMLNSGLSGLGYMSSDIGGFAVDPAHPTDPELYVRWLQEGVFTPMLRTHAQLKPEPYHYPEHEQTTLRYIKMRYEWLPYNYTLAYENARYGWPLARPLNFRGENTAKRYAELSDEYLWGDNVLVAPVVKAGARSRKVLFPGGGRWYDWYDSKLSYKGGSDARVNAPLDKLPLFVREGSFIPQYLLPIGSTERYDPAFLTVRYYPSERQTSYTMYDDDRLSPNSIADGAYRLLNFKGESKQGTTSIMLSSEGGGYEGMPGAMQLTFELECCDRTPRYVTLSDGTELKRGSGMEAGTWGFDRAKRVITLTFQWNYSDIELTVK